MPGVQKITLGYGSTPETARDNWKNVAFNTSGEDRESCQRAVEVAHTSFVPILYRFEQDDSNRDVLVSAAADRWMRHYTTDEPPEPTNESRE